TVVRQDCSSICANNSPRINCLVKFLDPTTMSWRVDVHPAVNSAIDPERNARRSSMSVLPARQELFHATEKKVRKQGHERGWDSARKNHAIVHHRDAAEDELAQPACSDGGSDRRHSDRYYCGNADSCEDNRRCQRQFDMPEQLA